MDRFSPYVVAGLTVTAGSVVFLAFSYRKPRSSVSHLQGYVPDPVPSAFSVLQQLPLFMRKWLSAQIFAPRQKHIDARDFKRPDAQVYEYEEVVIGKVWRVAHCFQSELLKFTNSLGHKVDDAFKKTVLDRAPGHMKETLRKDLERHDLAANKIREADGEKGEWFKAGIVDVHHSMVAKLPSGGLLLYAPPRIHDDLAAWLDALGPVEYIVLGSNCHSSCIPGAATRYPNARIVGPEFAERKCKMVGVKPFDCRTSSAPELNELNKTLSAAGVYVHHVDGSSFDEVLVTVHRQVFECDLVYTASERDRMWASKKEWETAEAAHMPRMLYYGMVLDSFNKTIPNYRIAFMDSTSPLPRACGIELEADCCARMASSLRSFLARDDWDQALGVHLGDKLSRAKFCNSIDLAWGWLDPNGKRLVTAA